MALNPQVQQLVDAYQVNYDKLNTDLDVITTEFADLNKKIQDLQNAPGNLGPEDNAAFADIAAKSAAIAAKADALVVPPVPSVETTATPFGK